MARSAVVLALLVLLSCAPLRAQDTKEAVIRVRCGNVTGAVNPLVFGNNFIGYDPATYEDVPVGYTYHGYSDYGAGIWDPDAKKPVEAVCGLARRAGITIARFPGGCGSHKYDWKKAAGPGRKHFRYGIDEFMATCEAIGCEAVYTLSWYIGDEKDAADLVEYLNAPCDGSNPNGGIDWAARRSEAGHPEPYGVKYFEVGNEEWHGDHRPFRDISPRDYARRYLRFYEAIKAVDPAVQVGVILHIPEWNEPVLDIIRDRADFAVLHPYPSARVPDRDLEKIPAKTLFTLALARVVTVDEHYLGQVIALIDEKCRKPLPLAITEYNAGFAQEKPVPYRHTLGAALVNAEFLRILMKPANRILMANYWQFCNSYWGMVYSSVDFRDPAASQAYVARPNFYVYELYTHHFGEELLDAEVTCGSYTLEGLPPSYDLGKGVEQAPPGTPVQYLTVNASRRKKDGAVCLMVVNKDMARQIPCSIVLEDFEGAASADIRVLHAPSVDSHNEGGRGVELAHTRLDTVDIPFTHVFPAHSLTSIEITPSRAGKEH